MHRRRQHPAQHGVRRRAPCAQEPVPQQRRDADAPVGPYIDLTNPAEPKLIGTLPKEFEEFGRILLAQAADAARERADGEAAMPALPPQAARAEKQQHNAGTQAGPSTSPASSPSLDRVALQQSLAAEPVLISSGQYRTREENRVEIARMTRGSPQLAAPPQPGPVKCDVRRDWLGRTERWYTVEEVARHCSPTDLWLTAHGKVYDVTEWVETHPGGAAALLRRAGRDATRDLDFHSKRARAQWEATCIGRLDDGRAGGLSGWLGL